MTTKGIMRTVSLLILAIGVVLIVTELLASGLSRASVIYGFIALVALVLYLVSGRIKD